MTTPLFCRALRASWCNLLNACHNAGIARDCALHELTEADWDLVATSGVGDGPGSDAANSAAGFFVFRLEGN